jgi:hypothetical protein
MNVQIEYNKITPEALREVADKFRPGSILSVHVTDNRGDIRIVGEPTLSERFGGPIVAEFPGYALRDDRVIREGYEITPTQAYSLFDVQSGERVSIVAGTLEEVLIYLRPKFDSTYNPHATPSSPHAT